jgi:hypothetical protein
MGAIASLDLQLVAVAPGAEASLEVKIRNNGSVVDQMTVSVLGSAASWAAAEPSTLSLFPGAEGTATVTFRPPRSVSVPAGEMAFGVRVASQEDPAGSTVEEGKLEIEPFTEVGAELQPLTSRGSRGGKHDLAIDNRGNVALNANIAGLDPSEEVAFDIKPPAVMAEAGAAAFAEVEVKPRHRFWRGRPKSRSFTIQVEAADEPPVPITGTFLQEPMLPGWLIKGVIGLAALIIALLVLWFLVLQPTVLTTAEDRAQEAAQEAAEEVLTNAGIPLEGGGAGAGGGSPTPEPSSELTEEPSLEPNPELTPAPTSATLLPEGDPVAGRLRAERNPEPFVPEDEKTLFVTDLVFSNPTGEAGALRLRRNGEAMLTLMLENFRDLDFHFVTPIVVGPGDRLDLWCQSCADAAVFYSGYER